MSTLTPHVPPLQRAALLAALDSFMHTLRRMRGGYVALGASVRTSGPAVAHTVTRRMALRLEREGLARFDEPDFPTAVTLTPDGVVLAEQLRAAYAAKARAA